MASRKTGTNPLHDMILHGAHPFPSEIEDLLRKIDTLGRRAGRTPLGENWPFSPDEFQWQRGENLDEARESLEHVLAMLEAGRGDEVFIDPKTQKPFRIQGGKR